MHSVIRVIVYAKDNKDARQKAEVILNDRLGGEGEGKFDYGTFFDEDSSVSGKSRWGNLPVVALADSKEGMKLIADGMKYTKNNFKERIVTIRKLLKDYNDEELFEEKILEKPKAILVGLKDEKEQQQELFELKFFKYNCSSVGSYSGPGIYLYDNDGQGIMSSEQLQNTLNKYGSKDYEGLKVYVVPIDVHY